jgi:hypothetical protein
MFDDFDTQIQCEEFYQMPTDTIVYFDPEFVIERAGTNIYRIVWENGKTATVEETLEEAIFFGESFGNWD